MGADAMAEVKELREVALMAYRSWDKDEDTRLGKLLRAMVDPAFAKTYLPEMQSIHPKDNP
ncbi:hypothetical protein CH75_06250 [Dyella jiangningensis]|nr:hypothetical protein CH75_06250 [Dyella jiangningensis]